MSVRLRHVLRDRHVVRAFAESPEAVTRQVSAQMRQGARLVERAWKLKAAEHDLFGTHKNAIHVEQPGPLHFRVASGVNYARALEEGTGPAVGRARYIPNLESLKAYVKRRTGIRWGRSGSPKRRSQEREVRDRAFGLLLHIVRHGTKAHPMAEPALEENRSELHRLIQRGAWLGLAEVFGP